MDLFRLEENPTAKFLRPNELRVHGLYYSVDPSMRGRMNAAESYIPSFQLEHPIEGRVVARVAESKAEEWL